MQQYLDLLEEILINGETKDDRTGVGTIGIFGAQLKFNLNEGFPAVTTKKLAWKGVVSELLWFLEGSDDERRLAEIRYNKTRSELDDLDKYKTFGQIMLIIKERRLVTRMIILLRNLVQYMASSGEAGTV